MMQNRVNPFGSIISTSARGSWLGNRGQLHDSGKTILRPFKHKAWISCELQFKGRHREIMAPNLWTELFFLDEATALSAGHRPCFECRREAANRFKNAWLKGNPAYGFEAKTPIAKLDEVLQAERIDAQQQKVTYTSSLTDLPNGTFIAIAKEAYLLTDGVLHRWSPFGYTDVKNISTSTLVEVLTPRSMVNALSAGYLPQLR